MRERTFLSGLIVVFPVRIVLQPGCPQAWPNRLPQGSFQEVDDFDRPGLMIASRAATWDSNAFLPWVVIARKVLGRRPTKVFFTVMSPASSSVSKCAPRFPSVSPSFVLRKLK